MNIKDGLIPTALGSVVTAAGIVADYKAVKLRSSRKNDVKKMAAAGIVGFGLAHIVLGTIDLLSDNK